MQPISKKIPIFSGCAMIIFISCMENPIEADLSNAALQLDTLRLYDIKGVTYQVPPSIGSKSRLYLGSDEGYDYRVILFKSSFISNQSILWTLSSFLDTTVTIDSAFLVLNLAVDTLEHPKSLSLYYFPDSTDSVFSESESNYLNFSDAEIAAGLYVTSAFEEMVTYVVDSLEETDFRLRFSIIELFGSTFIGPSLNYTLMLKLDEPDDMLHPFYSREHFSSATLQPRFEIYFHQTVYPDSADTSASVTIDTLMRSFNMVDDLSILAPPALNSLDTTYMSIGRGKGLRTIVKLNFLDTLLLPSQTTFDKANLTFYLLPDTNVSSFSIFAVPLSDTVDIISFESIDSDSISTNNYLLSSGNVYENKVVFSIKNFLQDHYFSHVGNFGIKLYANVTNNLQQTIHFHSSNHDSLYPRLFIQYVAP